MTAERAPCVVSRFPTETSPWNQVGAEGQAEVSASAPTVRQAATSTESASRSRAASTSSP
ncbi:hypothetical protein P8T65_13170 [Streptomyces sp. 11x1]|nr:hypothetical protein [Streptomyces sp. 11x1]WNZ08446.1 hypothetical protein P8T65_13170 [Streptomyces sp. 11x1]